MGEHRRHPDERRTEDERHLVQGALEGERADGRLGRAGVAGQGDQPGAGQWSDERHGGPAAAPGRARTGAGRPASAPATSKAMASVLASEKAVTTVRCPCRSASHPHERPAGHLTECEGPIGSPAAHREPEVRRTGWWPSAAAPRSDTHGSSGPVGWIT
ncbi:hypothetical protein AV521_24005 [Streptomyces sp. IMTB 2501]|nr:hypothetical protein AV521_24005 [Streptomyces sp. IMTB 2501]